MKGNYSGSGNGNGRGNGWRAQRNDGSELRGGRDHGNSRGGFNAGREGGARGGRGGANFPQQTHFIGVLLPEDITRSLEDCRRYMREAYGCRTGHGTPIHVTLVPPFKLPEEYSTEDLARAIENDVLPKGLGFSGHIDNFDAFGDRTLFAKVVQDEKWTSLRDAVYSAVVKAAPGCTKKDGRPFAPHLTVANRDIPLGVITDALQRMNELNLVEDFPVDNITIFERQGGKWVSAVELEL